MPKYNGVSECLNWTFLECTCTLLHSSKLPKNLWEEAINHVTLLKNRTSTCALPEGITPYEMLYNKKLNIRGLHEWGNQVWIHTSDGTKLDGHSRIGRWIGYDEISNGYRIYWPNKCLVTIEHRIKFVNDNVIFLSNTIAELIQGENDLLSNKNQQHDPETKSLKDKDKEPDTENYQDDSSDPIIKNPSTKVIDFITDKQNQQQVPENQTTSEPQSQKTRIPTRYIKDIQSGVGMINGRSGKSNLPPGILIPKPITQIQGDTADTSQIEHAMAITVSKIEAIDPLSLEEAIK